MAAPRPSAHERREDLPFGSTQAMVPAWVCRCAKCGHEWVSVAGPAIRDNVAPTWAPAPVYCGRCRRPGYDQPTKPVGRPAGPRRAP